MGALKERLERLVTRIREASPLADRAWFAVMHFVRAGGSRQAAATTYFAFLSFFPVLALGFFAVGLIARVYPDAQDNLETAIESFFPGIIGPQGQVSLSLFESNAGRVGIIGLVGVLYAGLGWLSGMRGALWVMLGIEHEDRPNFLIGKLRDLMTLGLLGVTLIVSVALSSAVNGFSSKLVELIGFDPANPWPSRGLWLLATALGIAVTSLLFLTLFRILVRPEIALKYLWQGALLGAVLFEALKWAAVKVIAHTSDQPAFQAFGVALVVVVWINYFSRIVMLGAAWALAGDDDQRRETEEQYAALAAIKQSSEDPARQ